MITRLVLVASGLLLWAGGLVARADVPSALEADSAGWQKLVVPEDFAGWTRQAIPPTNQLGRAQWHVEPATGWVLCDGDGGHELLRWDREMTNGIFHVQFRFTPIIGGKQNYNSGVFTRNSFDGVIWHQAQLTPTGGYLFGNSPSGGKLKRFKTEVTERRKKPAGEWNTLEVTAEGKKLSVWLNGAVTAVWSECETPTGYLALESEGFRIEFKDLQYKVLPAGQGGS